MMTVSFCQKSNSCHESEGLFKTQTETHERVGCRVLSTCRDGLHRPMYMKSVVADFRRLDPILLADTTLHESCPDPIKRNCRWRFRRTSLHKHQELTHFLLDECTHCVRIRTPLQ